MIGSRMRPSFLVGVFIASTTAPKLALVSSFRVNYSPRSTHHRFILLQSSTPFEADFYANPYEDDDKVKLRPSTAVDPDTPLILGLNKYSHDTTLCAAHAATGQVLFALSKERLSRRKHDGGHTATLVEACLDALDLPLQNVQKVVLNNHHHRVMPLEVNQRHMEWEAALQLNQAVSTEAGYEDDENRLPHVSSMLELSHHLAHAYSTAAQAPFDSGLCVVMDGMGETFRTMYHALHVKDGNYTSDLSFGGGGDGGDDGMMMMDNNNNNNTTTTSSFAFQCIPHNLIEQSATSYFDWREAESVYTFAKTNATHLSLRPIFKRFTPENSPPTLDNHGFENMDSLGALYSRVSSHIFGDWNACGKVMGLAPWAKHVWYTKDDGGGGGDDDDDENNSDGQQRQRIIGPRLYEDPIVWGKLYQEGGHDGLQINRTLLEGTPLIARNDADLFDNDGNPRKRYDFDDDHANNNSTAAEPLPPTQVALEAIALSHRIQSDLETVVLDFVQHFQRQTGERNLCVAGGVALNSVLNGRLARDLDFDKTFVSPYPGDDGIAVGCCAFGLFGASNEALYKHPGATGDGGLPKTPTLWNQPLTPYLGPEPHSADFRQALQVAEPWLEIETIRDLDQRLQLVAQEIASGGVVAWYRSRSELGPRALGHRSLLADPRKAGLQRFINQAVKGRESFRPFAPSVLAEEAHEWFALGDCEKNASPYMSMTAMVHEHKRASIPAVTHVDGSSRLQTVTVEDEPIYHALIHKFYELTQIPMVLNTSFNTLPGEPIVESPMDAIRSFLCSLGSIEMLVMDDYVIKRKDPDLRRLLGEASKDGNSLQVEPACPQRTGRVRFQSSFELDQGPDETAETTTRVSMFDRPMHHAGNEWFDMLDELEGQLLSVCDGETNLNAMLGAYTAVPEEQELNQGDLDDAQSLLQNVVHRLVRLYEHTFISW